MTIKGTVRGKTIELPIALPYPDGQEITIDVIVANGAPAGSPKALLRAIEEGPRIDAATVDELDRAIRAGRRPVHFDGSFDADPWQ